MANESITSLSTTGSRIAPTMDICLRALASAPSNMSDNTIYAPIAIGGASPKRSILLKNQRRKGSAMSLDRVRIFGTVSTLSV